MRALLAAILTLLVFAAWAPAAAQEASALAVELRPVTTSLEPGKAYLVGFSVHYACGPSRTIRLEVEAPAWTEAAVSSFRTRADRCLAPHQGVYSNTTIVDVFQDAEEGLVGNLTLVARDGDATASASIPLKVRQSTPRVDMTGPSFVLGVPAGETLRFDLTTTYTSWEPGRMRWIGDAPEGWRVAVPSARTVQVGEDVPLSASFTARPPADAAGSYAVGVRAVLLDARGVRVAEGPVVSVAVEVTPLPPDPDAPLEGADAPAGPEPERTVPPRAPWWALGGALVLVVAGIYVFESREERRRPPGK